MVLYYCKSYCIHEVHKFKYFSSSSTAVVFNLWNLDMTRKVVSLTENSSAVHRSMLKEPWIGSETSKGDISKNKSREVKSMSDHINFENVLKEKSSDKNTIVNLHSVQSVNNIVKINNKKSTKKLYRKKLIKIGRQKSPKLIRPFRCTKLPYGCVWNGKEGRFAIRIHSPKLKNGM